MALVDTLKAVGKQVNQIVGGLDLGKLEKATIYLLKSETEKSDKKPIKVQFNPQSYSIQRGVRTAQNQPVPVRDALPEPQATSPEQARLSVQLIFDTYSEYGMGQSLSDRASDLLGLAAKSVTASLKDGEKAGALELFGESLNACNSFVELIRFEAESHTAPRVAFVWGPMNFQGLVESQSINYTMFSKNGTPVRVALDMTIVGEEAKYKKKAVKSFESPDRTKRRTLEYGETLWMMADREYGNAGEWKTIAKANGILNPRTLDGVRSLKVPSIR